MAPPSGRTCGSPAARRPKMSRGWKSLFGPSETWATDDDAHAIASADTSKARRMETPRNLSRLQSRAGRVCPERRAPLHDRIMAEAFNDKILPAEKAERYAAVAQEIA